MSITPRELAARYRQGENITALLREEQGTTRNTEEIIEVAYDIQTGSYVAAMSDPAVARHKQEYAAEIARTIASLCRPRSVLEAGVGEATTLSGVLKELGADVESHGFDLSWSRVAYARRWLADQGVGGTTLCTGSLLNLPYADASIDVVYTSHSIEPNGGNEERILRELHRVARRFVVLLEPGYELAGDEARRRMESHGYCRNLQGTAERLGYAVLRHELFPFAANPLNPTALTILAKDEGPRDAAPTHVLACPRFKTPLVPIGDALYGSEALVVYPVLDGIPCLRVENGVVASKFPEVAGRTD